MQIIETSSFFKKVSSTGTNPRAGMKRPDLKWSFEGVKETDISELNPTKVTVMVNSVIEAFGRKKIAEAGDDWDFVPSGVGFEAAFNDLVKENTKTRLVTKDSLKALGAFYEEYSIVCLGVSIPAAKSGAALIESRFKTVIGKNDVLKAMESRLGSLVEAMVDSPEDEIQEAILPFAELIEAILRELKGLQEETISADAL